VQFRVLREKRAVVAKLVDLVVPSLSVQDAKLAAIADLPEDPSSHREVTEARRANRDSHKREHQRFVAVIRELMSLAIIGGACRPRDRKGVIMYDALPLIEQHGKERMYKGIRIPVGGTSNGDTWLFDLAVQTGPGGASCHHCLNRRVKVPTFSHLRLEMRADRQSQRRRRTNGFPCRQQNSRSSGRRRLR